MKGSRLQRSGDGSSESDKVGGEAVAVMGIRRRKLLGTGRSEEHTGNAHTPAQQKASRAHRRLASPDVLRPPLHARRLVALRGLPSSSI